MPSSDAARSMRMALAPRTFGYRLMVASSQPLWARIAARCRGVNFIGIASEVVIPTGSFDERPPSERSRRNVKDVRLRVIMSESLHGRPPGERARDTSTASSGGLSRRSHAFASPPTGPRA